MTSQLVYNLQYILNKIKLRQQQIVLVWKVDITCPYHLTIKCPLLVSLFWFIYRLSAVLLFFSFLCPKFWFSENDRIVHNNLLYQQHSSSWLCFCQGIYWAYSYSLILSIEGTADCFYLTNWRIVVFITVVKHILYLKKCHYYEFPEYYLE